MFQSDHAGGPWNGHDGCLDLGAEHFPIQASEERWVPNPSVMSEIKKAFKNIPHLFIERSSC
jgi:hypothetical protein